VWVPAPTTVDHGPPHLPPSPMAFAAKMTIAFLIVLALGGVVLFLLKWW
jgi:hypothetical protein